MRVVSKKNIVFILIIVWFVLWANFIVRDLFVKGYMKDYLILAKRNIEGKRSYTYGDKFYTFLKFAKDKLPLHSTYRFEGVEDLSLAYRRGVYYMYPSLENENPAYILVYEKPGYRRNGYSIKEKLDNARFILKRN